MNNEGALAIAKGDFDNYIANVFSLLLGLYMINHKSRFDINIMIG